MAWLLPRTGLNDLENVPKTLLPADKRVCLSFAFTIMVVKIKATYSYVIAKFFQGGGVSDQNENLVGRK